MLSARPERTRPPGRIAAFVAILLGLAAPAALAAESPTVFHRYRDDGIVPGVEGLESGVQDLSLVVEIGVVATNAAEQTVCVDGEGDEICGFTIALQATGGVSLVGFCPGNQCAPGLIHHLDPATGILRINRLGPAIAQAQTPFLLGRLTVSASGEAGEVRVLSESQAVSANLQVVSVRDPAPGPVAVWLPEPGLASALAAGAALLAGAARRRVRARRIEAMDEARRLRSSTARPTRRRPSLLLLLAPFFLLPSARPASAQTFTDQATFSSAVNALGSPPERLGFETVPRTPAGYAALGQDVRLGPVSLRSRSLAGDVDLAFFAGVPLGLFGTLLVADPGATGDPALHPGGTAQGSGARGDDDLRIVFDPPMRAAGLEILDNVAIAGEEVRFLDGEGGLIASVVLPGGAAPLGADGFVGYVIQPGDAPIVAIEVEEDADDFDDIAVDEILFETSADAFADAVDVFTPTVEAGEPTTANLDPAKSLERPDGQTVSLGRGGKLSVRFVDNMLSGSGDALPDLRIHEADADLEGSVVSVSANGTIYTIVGQIEGGTQSIDLDAAGFGPNDRLPFVRIVDLAAQGAVVGPSVGADIDAVEALSGRWLPPDADGDRVADDFDVCPTVYDALQADDDADGVGNACDNCRHVPNPGQGDVDADGEGDACERLKVRLIREFDPVNIDGRPLLATLRIDCGGFDVSALTLGLWVPPGPANFDFGGNCQPPAPAFAPPGAPTGIGCTGPGILVGPTVGGPQSGAFGVPRGDAMPPGFRPDVVYLTLRGSVANGGKLCSAFQSNVFLGRLRASAPLSMSTDAVASISLEDPIEQGWCLAADGSGTCREPAFLTYSMGSGLPMEAEIRIQPAADETSLSASSWDVCIADTTVSFMHRVTLGLLGPLTADYPTLFLDDCLVGPNGGGKRSCAGEVGIDPEAVDESVTFTQGPLPAPSGDLLPDTLYTPIEGGAPGTGGIDVLNRIPFRDACVGIVTNDTPPATPGAPPIPVRDGFFDLDYHDAGGAGGPQPYQTADGVLQALDGASVYETIVFNEGDDLDGDGLTDPVDNCPFTANPDQADAGGFATTVPNGRGNACECGDANGSGKVVSAATPETGAGGVPLVPDLQRIREYLVGMHPGDATIEGLCSVAGDTACDAADAVVLERALAGLEAVPAPRCAAAVD
jgi:hypothetical protein